MLLISDRKDKAAGAAGRHVKQLLLILLLWGTAVAHAAQPVYRVDVAAPMKVAYDQLYRSLEERRLWVVFEADTGRNLEGMAKRLGDDYNRNGLQGIRSMVVCNAWYANRVSNLDPDMLALCPLRVTVVHKDGNSRLLFARRSVQAADSPALPVVREIEAEVIGAIDEAARLALQAKSEGN